MHNRKVTVLGKPTGYAVKVWAPNYRRLQGYSSRTIFAPQSRTYGYIRWLPSLTSVPELSSLQACSKHTATFYRMCMEVAIVCNIFCQFLIFSPLLLRYSSSYYDDSTCPATCFDSTCCCHFWTPCGRRGNRTVRQPVPMSIWRKREHLKKNSLFVCFGIFAIDSFSEFRNTVPAVSFVCQFFGILRFRYYFVTSICQSPGAYHICAIFFLVLLVLFVIFVLFVLFVLYTISWISMTRLL